MAEKIFFESKETKKLYEVIELNDEAGTVTLKNKDGKVFTEPFSKERFKKMGYRPVTKQVAEDDED